MKKLILSLSFTFFSMNSMATLDSNQECHEELTKHVLLINETNETFKQYAELKNTELTSYQVSNFEHLLTSRVLHMKTLAEMTCEKNAARELIIAADYISIGKILLPDFTLRRIISTLIKYKKSEYKNFKSQYKKYTTPNNLTENLNLLQTENNQSEVEKISLNLDLSGTHSVKTLSDLSVNTLSGAIAAFAVIWGKLSDATVWREGHLKDNALALELLRSKLKPFDLIYESRNYTLSHLTIPGHFGHVAIWMGTKDELQSLGLWDQDFMKPFQAAIEEGKNIIELRKPGVLFAKLENFINLDEIAVTRVNNIENSGEAIFKGLTAQFGKKYDYKFNAHSSNKITCAELITYSYGNINWPASSKMSVVNLRPDDLAMYTILNQENSTFVAFLKGNKDSKSFESYDFEAFKKLFK